MTPAIRKMTQKWSKDTLPPQHSSPYMTSSDDNWCPPSTLAVLDGVLDGAADWLGELWHGLSWWSWGWPGFRSSRLGRPNFSMKLFSRLWLSLRSVCLPVMAEEAPPIIVYILTGFISKLLQKKSPAPSLPFIWFTFIYFQHWASSLPPGDIITNLHWGIQVLMSKIFLSKFHIWLIVTCILTQSLIILILILSLQHTYQHQYYCWN